MVELKRKNPVTVFILSIITCGIYLIFWYYIIYTELKIFTKQTPTGNSYGLDLFLTIISCGLWGIYVDYKISKKLHSIRTQYNLPGEDTSLLVLILDSLSIFSAHLLWMLTSTIQQDEWNKIIEQLAKEKQDYNFGLKPNQNSKDSNNPYS